jgi:hypothetical protein
MKAVDFYKLPRSIQDRFVGSVTSGFPPAPLLAQKGGTPLKLIWLAVAAACFVALVVAARLGYGSLDSGLALHSWRALPLYLGLVFGIGFGLVAAFGRLVRERAVPYPSGVYLFPACLIDARSDKLKIYSTQDLSGVSPQGSSIRVGFSGGSQFVFAIPNPQMAPQIVAEIHGARDRAMHARATEDPKELVAVDPLHNPRFSSPVGPREAYAIRRPPWGKLGWVVAGVLAVAIGPVLWALRNSGSDKKLYARATQANDSASYRAYLERGQRYRDEVSGTLLPRAELRDAEREGTVEALIAFKAEHPSTNIEQEIALSIRGAMLGELEKAKAQGSLKALDAFAKAYPDHGVGPELRTAIHAVYQRELATYKEKAPKKDKNVVPFVERLFAWAEKHGPRVEVRFRRKGSNSLGRADQHVGKTPSFMGEVSYPSKYFDDRRAVGREEALGRMLVTELDSGLSAELFDVDMGPVVTEPELPTPKVPTLFITHSAEWSGHSNTSTKPRGIFVGIVYPFDAQFVIPGDPTPLKFKNDILKLASTQVLKEDDPPLPPGKAEEKVYETMSQGAFEVFGKRLLALFFSTK